MTYASNQFAALSWHSSDLGACATDERRAGFRQRALVLRQPFGAVEHRPNCNLFPVAFTLNSTRQCPFLDDGFVAAHCRGSYSCSLWATRMSPQLPQWLVRQSKALGINPLVSVIRALASPSLFQRNACSTNTLLACLFSSGNYTNMTVRQTTPLTGGKLQQFQPASPRRGLNYIET